MWYEQLNFEKPKTLNQALNLVKKNGYQPISGGSDLLINLRQKSDKINTLVYIKELKELNFLKRQDNILKIGAAVTYTNFLKQGNLLPPLAEAISEIASPAIRNIGTIGGNIINASPAGDCLPVLFGFEAELVLKSLNETRILPISDFVKGPGKTDLQKGELLTEIRIKIPAYSYYYRKFGARKSLAISKVSFFGMKLKEENKIRLAYGAVGPKVIRATKAEKLFALGKVDEIPETIYNTVTPIDDQRSEADYRKHLCVKVTDHFLRNL